MTPWCKIVAVERAMQHVYYQNSVPCALRQEEFNDFSVYFNETHVNTCVEQIMTPGIYFGQSW